MEQMPRLLPGLIITIELSLIGFLIATILGVPLGVFRAYNPPIIFTFIIDLYVFVRGTPILVQIYLPTFTSSNGNKIVPF